MIYLTIKFGILFKNNYQTKYNFKKFYHKQNYTLLVYSGIDLYRRILLIT